MGVQRAEQHNDELSLAELLVDPMVQALMHADGIAMKDVVFLFLKARAQRVQFSANVCVGQPTVAKSEDLAITYVGAVQGLGPAPTNYAQLGKAVAALKTAKQQLRQAERRFDRDAGRDPSVLIRQVRTAEAKVRAARAAVARLERGSPA